ncbi:hypothetical protein PR048_011656, partial [Dryococelus australis]
MGRWIIWLTRFRFMISHVQDEESCVADGLSRMNDPAEFVVPHITSEETSVGELCNILHLEDEHEKELIGKNSEMQVHNYKLLRGVVQFIEKKSMWMPKSLVQMISEYLHDTLVRAHKKGNNFLLILVDGFTRFSVLMTMCDMKASAIAGKLENHDFNIFGSFKLLISDMASYFQVQTSKYYTCPNLLEQLNKSAKTHWLISAMRIREYGTIVFLNIFLNTVLYAVMAKSPGFVLAGDSTYLDKDLRYRHFCFCWHISLINVGELVLCKKVTQIKEVNYVSAKLAVAYDGPYKVQGFLTPITVNMVDLSNILV